MRLALRSKRSVLAIIGISLIAIAAACSSGPDRTELAVQFNELDNACEGQHSVLVSGAAEDQIDEHFSGQTNGDLLFGTVCDVDFDPQGREGSFEGKTVVHMSDGLSYVYDGVLPNVELGKPVVILSEREDSDYPQVVAWKALED